MMFLNHVTKCYYTTPQFLCSLEFKILLFYSTKKEFREKITLQMTQVHTRVHV